MSFEWFVGLFEGEGYISQYKSASPWNWMLGLSSTDRDVLERVVSIVGGKIYGPYRNNIPNRKPMYTWYISSKMQTVPLLEKMLPLLCSRRKAKAEEVLKLHYEYGGGPEQRKKDSIARSAKARKETIKKRRQQEE